jgi:signal transduction histidine kinase
MSTAKSSISPDAGGGYGQRQSAHDFRNLVQCALSAMRILRRSPEVIVRTGRTIEAAEDALERAAVLAHRIVNFSQPSVPQPISLQGIVLRLQDILRLGVGESVQLNVLVADQLPRVLCEASALENVLINLALNSRDALPGTGTVLIQVRECHVRHELYAGRRCVALSVADDGPGMPRDVAKRAMQPTFTTKGREGGFGLASAQEFINRWGGDLELTTGPEIGTTVTLHLPAHVDGAEAHSTS